MRNLWKNICGKNTQKKDWKISVKKYPKEIKYTEKTSIVTMSLENSRCPPQLVWNGRSIKCWAVYCIFAFAKYSSSDRFKIFEFFQDLASSRSCFWRITRSCYSGYFIAWLERLFFSRRRFAIMTILRLEQNTFNIIH